jgi:hypothetical protein
MIKNLVLELAEFRKVKIGEKGEKRKTQKGEEYRLPTKIDYFKICKLSKGNDENYIKDDEIHKKIGEKPKELEIMFIYNDIDKIFPTNYEYYESKKCLCRGDGETALTFENKEKKCPCEKLEQNKCKISGVLNFILKNTDTIGGIMKFRTHGFNSVKNILSSLLFIQNLAKGQLAFLPLFLTLEPKQTEKGLIQMANILYKGSTNDLFNKVLDLKKENFEKELKFEKVNNLQIDYKNSAFETDEDIEEEFYQESFLEEQKKENLEQTKEQTKEILEKVTDKKNKKEPKKKILTDGEIEDIIIDFEFEKMTKEEIKNAIEFNFSKIENLYEYRKEIKDILIKNYCKDNLETEKTIDDEFYELLPKLENEMVKKVFEKSFQTDKEKALKLLKNKLGVN